MGNDSRDVSMLMDAFNVFKKASVTLEAYYQGLEKKVEELNIELAEKNNYLTSVFEALPVGIIVTDNAGRIETVNDTACRILGETCEELLWKNIGDDRWKFSMLTEIEKIGVVDFETVIVGRDNRRKTISINSTLIKNLHGHTTGHLIVLKDMSEFRKLQESAQRDKRLKAMGEMAASIAHQIRNPLGSIELFASMLCEDVSNDNDRQRFAREIITAVKNLNSTLSNMLLFANNSKPYKTKVRVKDIIDDAVDTCRFLLVDKKVAIESLHIDPDIYICVDRELFKQVFLNLIMNSAEASDGEDICKVSITSKLKEDGLHVIISDNGCGIPENDLEEIFNPFFTSKPKGTGLGLTVVNNIIKAHGGLITVESTPEKGTAFDILILISAGFKHGTVSADCKQESEAILNA